MKDRQDIEDFEEINDTKRLELVNQPKKEKIRFPIFYSYFQLPNFVPASDKKGWVPKGSRFARRDDKLSAIQEATKIPE